VEIHQENVAAGHLGTDFLSCGSFNKSPLPNFSFFFASPSKNQFKPLPVPA
jgi:hypothetical protein